MKKDEIVKKYAFLMLLVGTALAFLVGSGILFGILCLANSSIGNYGIYSYSNLLSEKILMPDGLYYLKIISKKYYLT